MKLHTGTLIIVGVLIYFYFYIKRGIRFRMEDLITLGGVLIAVAILLPDGIFPSDNPGMVQAVGCPIEGVPDGESCNMESVRIGDTYTIERHSEYSESDCIQGYTRLGYAEDSAIQLCQIKERNGGKK